MATFNTAFGALPSAKSLTGMGANRAPGGRQFSQAQDGEPRDFMQQFRAQQQGQRPQQAQQQTQPQQTFAQLQQQGMARPAPPQAPAPTQFGQFGGSQQAQQLRQSLQQQLGQMAQQPSRFDTQAFQQIRGAQAANLQQEYRGQQAALDEELARRGLFASSIGGGRMGDLAGQQARALSTLDAQLLQQAAETQAQDRAQMLAAQQGLAELAGSQDLATFEANRVAQAAQAEQALRTAQFQQAQFESGGAQALSAAQAQQQAGQFGAELGLRAGELTGQLGGAQTLAAQQQAEQRRQFDIQQQLQQVLGLGGLGIQQRQQQAQEQQFGLSLAEQQAQRLQQAGISQQELGLRAQQLQQEAQLQGRSLTLQEAQAQAQTQLDRERLIQQGQQFGLQLSEQQAQRLQQAGISQQELGLRAQQLQQEAQLQGRSLTLQEANSQAQNQLERERLATQQQQFGVTTAEQQRQFDIQQQLQQVLGLGGLDIQRGQLGIEQQRLQQQTTDAAAERQLRETLQTRELSAQERQQLTEIEGRKALQTQQITEQARQFGLTLSDQQAARVYQGGFTTEELAIRRQQVDNELELQNRQLSETERNNLAIGNLQRDQFNAEKDFRADQLGLQRDELEQRAAQIVEDQRLRGVEIDDQRAYREAEIEARTTQIQNEFTRSGEQIDVENARIQAQRDLNAADNTAQTNRLTKQLTSQESIATADRDMQQRQLAFQNAQRLSEQSGVQYTVDEKGNTVVLRDAQGNPVRTSAFTQAEEARKLQEGGIMGMLGGKLTQEALQNAYQRAAQLSQVTGQQYTVDPSTGQITAAAGAGGGLLETLAAQLQRAELTGRMGQQDTLAARRQQLEQAQVLSSITGTQYTINQATGALEKRDLQTAEMERTELDRQLRERLGLTEIMGQLYDPAKQQFDVSAQGRTQAARQADLDRTLRAALGLSETSGYVYNPFTGNLEKTTEGKPLETVQGQLARSQMLMSLAQSLGNLTPQQIANLLGRDVTTTQAALPPSNTPPGTEGPIRPPGEGVNPPPTYVPPPVELRQPTATAPATPTAPTTPTTPGLTRTVDVARLPAALQSVANTAPGGAQYFADGQYWRRHNGQWYASSSPNFTIN